jgi:hypothetical protein
MMTTSFSKPAVPRRSCPGGYSIAATSSLN